MKFYIYMFIYVYSFVDVMEERDSQSLCSSRYLSIMTQGRKAYIFASLFSSHAYIYIYIYGKYEFMLKCRAPVGRICSGIVGMK